MRIVGIRRSADALVEVATLSEDGTQVAVLASLIEFWAAPAVVLAAPNPGATLPTARVTLVPPVLPDARVICVGLNYLKHVAEGSYSDQPIPEYPTLFARWTRTLTVDGAQVPVPAREEGLAAVVGYSTFNDLTSRYAQKLTSQWILGKNGDRSGPLGPMVPATEVPDLRDGLRVQTRVNGQTMQDATTDQMVYTVGDTLAHISHSFTLLPGDLLATGTPAGVGYGRTPPVLLQPGDVVEVDIDHLGVLRNSIVGNDARRIAARPPSLTESR